MNYSILFVGLGGKEELKAEVANEISVRGRSGLEAASGHEKKNDGAMEFVTTAKVKGGLIGGGMEDSLIVQLHIQFKLFREIMANDEASDPAIRAGMDVLIADFVVDINRPKFLGKLDGHEEGIVGWGDTAVRGVVRVVEKELRENRDPKAVFAGVVETPLHAGIRLLQAKLGGGTGILYTQPGTLVGELDAIADAEIDIDVRRVRNRAIAVKEWHVTKIDFPIEIAGRAGIVGVVGRPALGKRGSGHKEKESEKEEDAPHGYGAGRREPKGPIRRKAKLSTTNHVMMP